jgi:nucleoside triphosphatase
MRQRVNVVAIIHNDTDEILLCKQTSKGVYPGQWAIPGGGVELGEGLEEALRREIKEEVNLELASSTPFMFSDDVRDKQQNDGSIEKLHMIYLLFDCAARNPKSLQLNEEFEASEWVSKSDLGKYDLNSATVKTFTRKGWLK